MQLLCNNQQKTCSEFVGAMVEFCLFWLFALRTPLKSEKFETTMKRLISVFLTVFSTIALAVNATESSREHIGSIAEVAGQAELKSPSQSKIVALDPKADFYRPLYLGEEIRCLNGGSAKVNLLNGRVLTVSDANWTTIPKTAPPELTALARSAADAPHTRGGNDGPARRALLVGINTYSPPPGSAPPTNHTGRPPGSWTDLNGCINDVEGIQALLVDKYGFSPQNIVVLTNTSATRENILNRFRSQLVEPARPGDESFFFYAGHGSQVTNSATWKDDKKNETIVPCDSWRGAPDILDKEINRCLNAALDKGAIVTAIFDSCHSGSISRGRAATQRAIIMDSQDIKDGSDAGPNPNPRGALVFSAALRSQTAKETPDGRNGAFTRALTQVLSTCRKNESAHNIFMQTEALLRSDSFDQDPVCDVNAERSEMSLFGDQSGDVTASAIIPVLKVDQDSGEIELLGGTALGLYPKCQLHRRGATTTNDSVSLEIVDTTGPARATAKAIRGSTSNVKVGDVFEVDVWAAPDKPSLTVWLPPALKSQDKLEALLPALQEIRQSTLWDSVTDPVKQAATHFVEWNGKLWTVTPVKGNPISIGTTLTAAGLQKALGKAKAQIFVSLPPDAELVSKLQLGEKSVHPTVAVASQPLAADYELVGRFVSNRIQYAWIRPAASLAKKSEVTLPAATDWFSEDSLSTANVLTDRALRLSKIKGWLTLSGPADDGQFAYHLALKRVDDGEVINRGQVFDQQRYKLVLERDPKQQGGGNSRYVYVFILDCNGASKLLFNSNIRGGLIPDPNKSGDFDAKEIALGTTIKIQSPFSTDTYVMLTSAQQLSDPSILTFDGVRSDRGPTKRGVPNTGLQALLDQTSCQTRGASAETPTEWSVERVFIESCPTNRTADHLH